MFKAPSPNPITPSVRCGLCKELVTPGDYYYAMPDGVDVCQGCIFDWARQYEDYEEIGPPAFTMADPMEY